MPTFLKRLAPLLLTGIFLLQLMAIEKVSEPFPAILLPPFQSNSPIDSIQLSEWEVQLIEKEQNVKQISFQELFPMVPQLTAFYMTLSLTKEVTDEMRDKRKQQFAAKADWKQWFLQPRELALGNAWRSYPQALEEVRERARAVSGKQIDVIRMQRRTLLVKGTSRQIDTLMGDIAIIPLNDQKPEIE